MTCKIGLANIIHPLALNGIFVGDKIYEKGQFLPELLMMKVGSKQIC